MRRLRILGNFLTIIGILMIFSSTILPLVKLPQTLVKAGPRVTLNESAQYWIDTFILPTIDYDTPVLVSIRGEHAGGVSVTIIPWRDGSTIMGEKPIINYIFEEDQQTYTTTAKASMTSEYFVSVFCIRNNYTLTINSVWSPYYNLRAYLYLGLSALPAGLLVIYYDRILDKRDQIIKKAQAESSNRLELAPKNTFFPLIFT